jgi:hypothetical protein
VHKVIPLLIQGREQILSLHIIVGQPVNTHGHNLQDQVILVAITVMQGQPLRVLPGLQQDHLQAALIKEVPVVPQVVRQEAVLLLPLHEAALPDRILHLQGVVPPVVLPADHTPVAVVEVAAEVVAVVVQDADAKVKWISGIISKN